MSFSEDDCEYGQKLTFEEIVSRLHWELEIPTTRESFDNFLRCSRAEMVEAFCRLDTEIKFCCAEHGDLNGEFRKLQEFASLVCEYDNDEFREKIRSMFSALDSGFFELSHIADKKGLSREDLSLPLLAEKYNTFFTTIEPGYPFRLIDVEPYQRRIPDCED
jgi:hypothetical protein